MDIYFINGHITAFVINIQN